MMFGLDRHGGQLQNSSSMGRREATERIKSKVLGKSSSEIKKKRKICIFVNNSKRWVNLKSCISETLPPHERVGILERK